MKKLFTIALVGFIATNANAQAPYHEINWCTSIDRSDFVGSADKLIQDPDCINDNGNVDAASRIDIIGNKETELKAGKAILLDGEVFVQPTGASTSYLHIEEPEFEVVWYEPYATPRYVGKFEKVEFGIDIPDYLDDQVADFFAGSTHGGLNPYDESDISIKATFTHPGFGSIIRHAFYYQEYFEDHVNNNWTPLTTPHEWRVRFAPNQVGDWIVNFEVFLGSTLVHRVDGINFLCTDNQRKGYVIRGYEENENDWYLRYSDSPETFFAVGNNTAFTHELSFSHQFAPSNSNRHLGWIDDIADNGGNYFSLLTTATNFGIEWDDIEQYNNRQHRMKAMDKIFDKAEARELYCQLHVTIHGEFHEDDPGTIKDDWMQDPFANSWTNNPYRKEIAAVVSPRDFFTDGDAKEAYKRMLTYTINRWGYTPYIAVIEFVSEIDKILNKEYNDNSGSFRDQVNNWFADMKAHLQSLDSPYLLTMSQAEQANKKIKQKCNQFTDVVQLHKYGNQKNENYTPRFEIRDDFRKVNGARHIKFQPVIYDEIGLPDGEIGIYCCTDLDYHNTLWASSFMGTFGCGQHWWWDRGIHDLDYQEHLKNLARFFEGEQLHNKLYEFKRWKDKGNKNNFNKTKLESLHLISKYKERVLGWAHNTTSYWRNLYNTNSCIQDLVNQNFTNSPCIMDDGIPIACASCIHDAANYGASELEDNYLQVVNITPSDKKIKIKGLKMRYPFWRPYYGVTFYRTQPGTELIGGALAVHSYQELSPALLSNDLKIEFPKVNALGDQDNDYAFKIEFLGFNIKSHVDTTNGSILPKDSVITISDSTVESMVKCYPNPGNGLFNLEGISNYQTLAILDFSGRVLMSKSLSTDRIELDLSKHESGIYVIRLSDGFNYSYLRIIKQ